MGRILSPTIIGTALGSLIGLILFAPMVITHRTTESDVLWNFIGAILSAAGGFLFGLAFDRTSPNRPDDPGNQDSN